MAMQRKRRRRSGGNNNNNPNPNRHYESNGPDVRIRGSAQQILDKYLQYARDAQTSGDRVKAEALFQHAEHYARIVAEFEKQKEEARLEREAREAAKAEERAQSGRLAKVAGIADQFDVGCITGEVCCHHFPPIRAAVIDIDHLIAQPEWRDRCIDPIT